METLKTAGIEFVEIAIVLVRFLCHCNVYILYICIYIFFKSRMCAISEIFPSNRNDSFAFRTRSQMQRNIFAAVEFLVPFDCQSDVLQSIFRMHANRRASASKSETIRLARTLRIGFGFGNQLSSRSQKQRARGQFNH